ncbi:MAG: ABC transporter substrate-binding protein [Dethiobacteria bacterium]
MKKKMVYVLLAAILFMAPFWGGCSRPESNATKDLTPEEGYIIVTDYLGKKVKVKQNPDYIGSVFAVSSHVLAMFGDVEKIVAISEGNRRDFLFCEIYPQILEARVVKGNNMLNIEEIAKHPRPEVLIFNPEVTLDDKMMTQLEKLGIPIVTIAYDSMEQQQQTIELLGKIVGREEEAAEYKEYYRQVIELVTSRTKDIPQEERKTVYHAINELLRTDRPNSLSEDWLNAVGVNNVALQEGKKEVFGIEKNYVSLEELLQWDPEYIIINGGDVLDYINANKQLHNLRAYREGKIYLLPLGVSRWGHPYSIETPLAILWTAKTIYPELFPDIDIEKETRDFYLKFFDYQLSDEQVAKILSGREYKQIKGWGEPSVN